MCKNVDFTVQLQDKNTIVQPQDKQDAKKIFSDIGFWKKDEGDWISLSGYMKNESTLSDYLENFDVIIIIFSIFLLIGLVTWGIQFSYTICTCCCPLVCCQRNIKENPFKARELMWPVMCSTLFMIYLIIFSIFGIYYSAVTYDYYDVTQCMFVRFLDTFQNGGENLQGDQLWQGFKQISDKLAYLNENINIIQTSFQNEYPTQVFEDENSIFTKFGTIKDKSDLLITLSQDNTKIQYTTSQDPLLGSAIEQNSHYYEYFGPYPVELDDSTDKSSFKIVEQVYNYPSEMSVKIIATNQIATSFRQNFINFTEILKQANISMLELSKQTNNFLEDSYNFLSDVDDYAQGTFITIFVLNILILVFSVLGLLTPLFIILTQKLQLSSIAKCNWLFQGLFLLMEFTIVLILLPFSVGSSEFCEIFEDFITNEDIFIEYSRIIPKEISTRITTCRQAFGGNGQFLDQLDMKESLEQLNDIYNYNLEIQELYKQEVYKKSLETIIQNEILITDEVRDDGIFNDIYDHNNFEPAVNNLKTILNCDQYFDFGTYLQLNYDFDENTETTLKSIDTCNGPYDQQTAIDQFVKLRTYSDAKQTKVNEVQTILIDMKQATINFITLTDSFSESLQLFIQGKNGDKTVNYYNYINSGNKNDINKLGLVDGNNCQFVGDYLDIIFEGYCIKLVPEIYRITTYSMILAFGLLFSQFFMFTLGYRYSLQAKNSEVNFSQKQYNYHVKDQQSPHPNNNNIQELEEKQ